MLHRRHTLSLPETAKVENRDGGKSTILDHRVGKALGKGGGGHS